ncbi:hypothetical protein BLNAU_2921 [Blattamonas nauphoetae]|uniref:Transcription factor CBF/NF-Y/archaeal histone domain-containing protein n=1 Tax=Blattamonas nauphoetae TaxID=2049346 RepID=A0ABQ9YER7_9EUKA|nr:hypothetical protein BLNAU_2921 [Blattamonas nauphoetae]
MATSLPKKQKRQESTSSELNTGDLLHDDNSSRITCTFAPAIISKIMGENEEVSIIPQESKNIMKTATERFVHVFLRDLKKWIKSQASENTGVTSDILKRFVTESPKYRFLSPVFQSSETGLN